MKQNSTLEVRTLKIHIGLLTLNIAVTNKHSNEMVALQTSLEDGKTNKSWLVLVKVELFFIASSHV